MQNNIPPELREVFEEIRERLYPNQTYFDEFDVRDCQMEAYTLGQQAREKDIAEALEAFVKSCYTGCTKDELNQLRINAEKALKSWK